MSIYWIAFQLFDIDFFGGDWRRAKVVWVPDYSGMTMKGVGFSLPVAMQKAGARNIGGGWGIDCAPAYAGAGSQGGKDESTILQIAFCFLMTGPRPALGVTREGVG